MMKRHSVLLVGLLVLGVVLTKTWAGVLQASRIIDTGPFFCVGGTNYRSWTNNTGFPLFIKRAELLMLCDNNGSVNIDALAVRLSDTSILLKVAWDHYANPTTLHQHSVEFSPDYFRIDPNDTLRLQYFCG